MKVQFAEHPISEGGAEIVAFVNEDVVGVTNLLETEVLAVSVAKRVTAGACGRADAVAVTATNEMLVGGLNRGCTMANLLVHLDEPQAALLATTTWPAFSRLRFKRSSRCRKCSRRRLT